MFSDATFVCRRMVSSDFILWDATFVDRRLGFKGFYALGCNFCVQARGF